MVNEEVTIGGLARRVAMDRTQLYGRLRALTGLSPSQLLIERRLLRSAQLLAAGTGSVGEVAFTVGLKSTGHFSRRFLAAPVSLRPPTAACGRPDRDSVRRPPSRPPCRARRIQVLSTPGLPPPGPWPPSLDGGVDPRRHLLCNV